jgi:hypothetical protein
MIEADVDQALCTARIRLAPRGKELIATTERGSAEAHCGDAKT